MPHGPAHKRQRGKNRFLLVVLVSIVALFYFLTMVKIRGA
jgi:hypothetical protein